MRDRNGVDDHDETVVVIMGDTFQHLIFGDVCEFNIVDKVYVGAETQNADWFADVRADAFPGGMIRKVRTKNGCVSGFRDFLHQVLGLGKQGNFM